MKKIIILFVFIGILATCWYFFSNNKNTNNNYTAQKTSYENFNTSIVTPGR